MVECRARPRSDARAHAVPRTKQRPKPEEAPQSAEISPPHVQKHMTGHHKIAFVVSNFTTTPSMLTLMPFHASNAKSPCITLATD